MKDCKAQILSTIYDNTCCSHAFINSILTTNADINLNNNTILINCSSDTSAKISKIVNNFYPTLELNAWEGFLLLKGDLNQLLLDCGISEDTNTVFENSCDRLSLLKGFFVSVGRFYYNQDNSKNTKGYTLEFVVKDNNIAELINTLLTENGFQFKKIIRQGLNVLYTKNSSVVTDLFVCLGATQSALDIQNDLIIREMRNNANRQNNCFESNLEKTLTASAEQIKAINYIIDNYSIDYLPESLKEVALARIANPDVSLGDLMIILNKKLSRAGIKYRLDKIIDIYHGLKGDK